ncbi:hypothetical protein MAR_034648 [Mya arenaria]|uniref:Uncharacterized protein n=1 Tax=Mya arenaria TaxID=6604 RepID=A0ABY7EKS1_MYAAR|nr:hypothetical protein MAR_034648 [Mya arenaria]
MGSQREGGTTELLYRISTEKSRRVLISHIKTPVNLPDNSDEQIGEELAIARDCNHKERMES